MTTQHSRLTTHDSRLFSLKAIIFDFNGVIVNDEPIHLKMFQKILKEEGIRLSAQEYYSHYLAFDDKNCFEKILNKEGHPISRSKIRKLVERKAHAYEAYIEKHLTLFAGVKKWVNILSKKYPLAIASAALGSEIGWILKRAGILKKFKVIIAAEDTKKSKPDPESYLLALKKLNRFKKILPQECLVIEDSIAGVRGTHKAQMKSLALAHTYSKSQLKESDLVLKSFQELSLTKIQGLFKQ
ncbi:MAG: HAD family phosphatase [Chlamydiae bacterium]|nr:HAD family phosphatase [Chlamydiota bacterium]MBI3266691.1 HAD family phosphatase [Chlamydiota bacterium]